MCTEVSSRVPYRKVNLEVYVKSNQYSYAHFMDAINKQMLINDRSAAIYHLFHCSGSAVFVERIYLNNAQLLPCKNHISQY